ncbi:hypothetical protein QFZ51_003516 [Chitinophaga sp. W3I9]|uniref:hypothetical protein n=1 Tax=Chitinophaga sp. W3I9 TaxID=3373924 RepID=UPI003D19DD1E
MATVKKDAIVFTNGREINVPGGIVSITRSLELTDYYSRNVLYHDPTHKDGPVVNIYGLNKDEAIEIADLMIQLWIELKDNIRQFNISKAEIFRARKGSR